MSAQVHKVEFYLLQLINLF